jgi:hypothetical protein
METGPREYQMQGPRAGCDLLQSAALSAYSPGLSGEKRSKTPENEHLRISREEHY